MRCGGPVAEVALCLAVSRIDVGLHSVSALFFVVFYFYALSREHASLKEQLRTIWRIHSVGDLVIQDRQRGVAGQEEHDESALLAAARGLLEEEEESAEPQPEAAFSPTAAVAAGGLSRVASAGTAAAVERGAAEAYDGAELTNSLSAPVRLLLLLLLLFLLLLASVTVLFFCGPGTCSSCLAAQAGPGTEGEPSRKEARALRRRAAAAAAT